MAQSLSILFAGTPEFSVPALQGLLRSSHRVRAVYTQPDRPAGRGRQLTQSAVKQCAIAHGIPVEQPVSLRDSEAQRRLIAYDVDAMVVVAYGLILPLPVLSAPRRGCINIHASLLPRWRGAAPIQRAILAGDTMSGITIMQMDQGLDTGPALLTRTTSIGERETAATLHDRLAELGASAIVEALDRLQQLTPQPQPLEGVTYAAKIRKEEAMIDWGQSATQIDRQVRAFNPWPIAETRWGERQLRVWEAQSREEARSAPPGTVIACSAEGIEVAAGEGSVLLKQVQIAGRRAMSAAELLNAHSLHGVVLG